MTDHLVCLRWRGRFRDLYAPGWPKPVLWSLHPGPQLREAVEQRGQDRHADLGYPHVATDLLQYSATVMCARRCGKETYAERAWLQSAYSALSTSSVSGQRMSALRRPLAHACGQPQSSHGIPIMPAPDQLRHRLRLWPLAAYPGGSSR